MPHKRKIVIDMLSHATSAPAQGVGSAYLEQKALIEDFGKDDFEVMVNQSTKKADIVHVHSVNPGFYFKMNKKTLSVCYVHFLPETLKGSIRLPRPIFSLFCRYVVSFYKRAKKLVVVNPCFIEPLKKLGIQEENITYIPNFVDERLFHQVTYERKFALRKLYDIPEDRFVVIGVGQVQTRKGVLDFLKVAEENPDIFFLWLGGFSFKAITDGYAELKKEMEKKRENVRFVGIVKREKMPDYYALSDLFFLPSFNELFPMSLLEACSVGIPYLVRDLDLYRPILLGDYFKAADVSSFSKTIRELSKDKEKYSEGLDLSKRIREKYCRKSVYRLWKQYYLGLVTEKVTLK